jgi:hypothetical protein
MSSYVLSFRAQSDRTAGAAEEAAWGQWFGEIGAQIADSGHRVGSVRTLGPAGDGRKDALAGYVVINADDLDAAVKLAAGCPGLKHGASVEVGEAI